MSDDLSRRALGKAVEQLAAALAHVTLVDPLVAAEAPRQHSSVGASVRTKRIGGGEQPDGRYLEILTQASVRNAPGASGL